MSKAIVDEDKAALRTLSAAWRTDFDADALAQHVDQAVSTGPYVLDEIVPGVRVELVRNDEYEGDAPASYDRVVVRSDLDAARAGRRARGRLGRRGGSRRAPATSSTRSGR